MWKGNVRQRQSYTSSGPSITNRENHSIAWASQTSNAIEGYRTPIPYHRHEPPKCEVNHQHRMTKVLVAAREHVHRHHHTISNPNERSNLDMSPPTAGPRLLKQHPRRGHWRWRRHSIQRRIWGFLPKHIKIKINMYSMPKNCIVKIFNWLWISRYIFC